MKNVYLAPISRRQDPVLESMLSGKHEELKELAIKNARHFAFKNLPGPTEPNLDPYTSDLKNGYHQLAAQISKHLQPDAHFPEARMELDFLKDKNKQLDDKIQDLQHINQNVIYELGSFNPQTLQARVRFAVWTSLIICLWGNLVQHQSVSDCGREHAFRIRYFHLDFSGCLCLFAPHTVSH